LSQKTFLRSKKETLRYLKHSRNPEHKPKRIEPLLERLLLRMLKSTTMSTPKLKVNWLLPREMPRRTVLSSLRPKPRLPLSSESRGKWI
jgi:hypothetical protein